MIALLLIIPLIGCLLLLPVEENSTIARNKMKKIALSVSLLNLIVSIFMWIEFDANTTEYQFVYEFKQLSFCHLNVGIDGTSLYFVLLTTFITPICLLSNWVDITNKTKYFLISFLILETLQIAVFVVLDLLLFYIFFESVLIPLFIIILTWGASLSRIRAAFLLFLYTLFGSLFMLLAIMTILYFVGSTDFQLISLSEISLESQKWLWLAFFLAFAIKTPIWPLNTWLIKAHVEAPLAGSIILAGTILKLATYGYLRVLISILPDASNYFMPLVQAISIISLIYASLATIRQNDTKAVIAYSSVAHMAVVMLGLFSNTIQGIEGAILLSLGHGFVSPALFVCCGGIIYNRTHSRVIVYHRGLAYYMPVFTMFFLIFTLFNTGIPLSLNFAGEIMSLMGTWFRSPLVAGLGATGIVLSACYSIFFFNRISYGSYSPYLSPLKDIDRREFILLMSLLIPTLILGIFPNFILTSLHSSVPYFLYYI
uniref:NADH dehydrogenase subunit 4 n=1 Tax=Ramaria cf. rubripermanens TaxID=2016387 RepID=UPI0022373304|nr:NADH dehydrogenase subunit 4 [Ramaria cf. rubripermanens]UYR22161.1 NADH dehydrogenase subunit 4 [Ramaria cf. rubripermanens]